MDKSLSKVTTAVCQTPQLIEWNETDCVGFGFERHDKSLMNSKEACKYMRISARTLSRLMESRKIKYIKIGKSVRYEKADIDKFIENNKRI